MIRVLNVFLRESGAMGVVAKNTQGEQVYPVRTWRQIVGTRKWSLSLIRLDARTTTDEWLDRCEHSTPRASGVACLKCLLPDLANETEPTDD